MDFDNTPEDEAFRVEVRDWLQRNSTPRSDGHTSNALTVTDPAVEAQHVRAAKQWQVVLHEAGWAGIAWPKTAGGRGGTARQQAIFNQEEARFDAPQSVFGQGIGMAGPTLIAHGTDAQRQRFLPPMLRGDEIWCQLFSEPGAGSDLAGLSTRAERDGDTFVVNGQKVWTSSAQYSDWGILLARTDPTAPKHRGISYLLLDMTTPGVLVRPLHQITKVAHFNEVFLTDVRIPVENVVGAVNDGWRVATTTLSNERAMIGAGGASSPAAELVAQLRDSPHRNDAVLRQRVVQAYIHDRLLTYLGWRAQTVALQGREPGPESSVLKLGFSAHQGELGELGIEMLGAAGTLLDYTALDDSPLQARFLSQWASRIGGGTEQIQRNIIGERILGLPREPRPDHDRPEQRESRH